MKHLLTLLLAGLWCLSAAAQSDEKTESGNRLNSEFTFRGNTMLGQGTLNLTWGIRTNENNALGIGVGWGQEFYGYEKYKSVGQIIPIYVYHRLSIPLGKKERVSIYSDILGGGYHLYDIKNPYEGMSITPGDWNWYWSWQPGISVRLRGKSNIFLGPSVGPTIGFHVGFTI